MSKENEIELMSYTEDDEWFKKGQESLIKGSPTSAHLIWLQHLKSSSLNLKEVFNFELNLAIQITRRGDFKVSADGTLRDGTGTQPLSVDLEPVIIPPHRKISISGDGIIQIEPLNAPEGQIVRVGQLATTTGSEVPLAKSTDGFVRTINGTIPEPDNRIRLLSGFLEGSNVKSVDELVTGIDQSRAYEINVKFISTAREIDEASASLMRMPS